MNDPILERILAFNEEKGGGVAIIKRGNGYSLYVESDGTPLARIVQRGDRFETLRWSHRDRWESVGEFGGVLFENIEEALEFIAEDPMGCFLL